MPAERSWWALAAVASALVACATAPPRLDEGDRRWAVEVLLGSEDGARRVGVVRWREPVHYLVVGARRRAREAVEHAFAELRDALRGVHELRLSFVDAEDPRVGEDGFATVFLTAPRAAADLIRRYRARPAPGDALGWFTVVWRPDNSLRRAVAFVDPHLRGRWLRHTMLEEMMQVLGPCNDSSLRPSSVVYEGPVVVGSAERLADVDRELLALLYGHLQPGDDAAAIVRAMAGNWRTPR